MMMPFRNLVVSVTTLLSLSVVASSATSLLRGGLYSPWSCLFSGATNAKSCLAVTAETCVYCTASGSTGPGMCVTEQQSQTLIDKLHMTCTSKVNDDDDDAAGDDDAATDDAATDDAAGDDDDFMDGLLSCLLHGDDKVDCGKQTKHDCVWCTSQQYGVCITKEAADTVDTYQYFDCPDSDASEEKVLVE